MQLASITVRRTMRMRHLVLLGFLLLTISPLAQAALSPADSAIISDVAKKAAYMNALVDFCAQRTPSGGEQNQAAFAGWSERNHWSLFQELLSRQPKFQPAYQQMRAQFVRNLEAKGAQGSSICQHVPALMKRAEFDPSAQRAADIERVAAQLGQPKKGAAPQSQTNTAPVAPPEPDNNPPQAAPVASGPNLTVGEASFPTPAGWSAGKAGQQSASFNYRDKKGCLLYTF